MTDRQPNDDAEEQLELVRHRNQHQRVGCHGGRGLTSDGEGQGQETRGERLGSVRARSRDGPTREDPHPKTPHPKTPPPMTVHLMIPHPMTPHPIAPSVQPYTPRRAPTQSRLESEEQRGRHYPNGARAARRAADRARAAPEGDDALVGDAEQDRGAEGQIEGSGRVLPQRSAPCVVWAAVGGVQGAL